MDRTNLKFDGAPSEVLAYGASKVKTLSDKDIQHSVNILAKTIAQPKGNAFSQLQIYRKHIPILIEGMAALTEINKDLVEINDRLTKSMYARNRKPWTQEEDATLIDMVCQEGMTVTQLSMYFGRTPGAISSHISPVVGVSRITQEVAGRFIGYVDGEKMEVHINGTLYKQQEGIKE